MPPKAYYRAHPEKCRAQSKKSYHKNKSKVLAYQTDYRAKNVDKIRDRDRRYWVGREDEHVEHTRKWRQENPEKYAILKKTTKARRRAREKGAQGDFTTEQWMQKVEYHDWRCLYCGVELIADTLTLDHIKPLSKGGSNWVVNFAPSCFSCNKKKLNKLDFVNERLARLKTTNNAQ